MSKNKIRNTFLQEAVDELGSQKELAKLIGVSQQSVGRWVNNASKVPAEYCLLLEKKTKGLVKAVDLRPDLPWE